MRVQQFEDKGLAHFSYLILSESDRRAVVVDPARDPKPYLDAMAEYGATLVGIIETHPHADFVSSHAELARTTGAPILASGKIGAEYAFQAFNDGDRLELEDCTLVCMETPGHSADSISILVYEGDVPTHLISGDTLFVGDVGRPDLREKAGALMVAREEQARMMYQTIQNKLLPLPDDVVVYPAHGAGSLCGKALSDASSTTIGQERLSNPSLQPMAESEFVKLLLADQPFVPKYFGGAVELNRKGAPDFEEAIKQVPRLQSLDEMEPDLLIIDSRSGSAFKAGHLPGSINLQRGGKFDTWLGSIVAFGEPFYMIATTDADADWLLRRAAAIGYEGQIQGYLVANSLAGLVSPQLDVDAFLAHTNDFTILDIRNRAEHEAGMLFASALPIPLPELRERIAEVPAGKPVVVHCAAGYRSAAGQSILEAARPDLLVYDLGEAIKEVKAPQFA